MVSIVLWSQSANDDDTCLNVDVGLWPQDVFTTLAQESQKEPKSAQESSGAPKSAQGPRASKRVQGSQSLRCEWQCIRGADGHSHYLQCEIAMCALVRIVMFRGADGQMHCKRLINIPVVLLYACHVLWCEWSSSL